MLAPIVFAPFWGLPLIAWGGMFTFLCFIITAIIAYLTVKGIKPISVKWHYRFAILSLILGLFHGLVGLLAFLGI